MRVDRRVVMLLVLAALGMGCKETLTPNDMADHATQQLGIPVFFWGKSDDVCLVRQVRALYDEYAKANDQGKAAIAGKLQRFNAIEFRTSEDVGTINRTTYELQLFRSSDERVARRAVLDWKQSSQWQSSSGKYPGTRIEKGEQLVLTPVKAADLSVKRTFATFDGDLYRNMGSSSYVDIESSYRFGTIQLLSETKPDPVNCGKLAQFKDLF